MGGETSVATAAACDNHRRWQPGAGVLACKYDGGTVLLSLATGKYFTLNQTASGLWERLVDARTIDEAARSLATEYEISLETARQDAGELLSALSTLGLIAPRLNRHADVSWPVPARRCRRQSQGGLTVPSFLGTWLTLVKFHILLRLGRLAKIADPSPNSSSAPSDTILDPVFRDALTRRVRTAAAWLPFRVACLAQSLTVIEILRKRGHDAALRVGIYPYPFSAHAWAECGGHPVNELPEELLRYRAITR